MSRAAGWGHQKKETNKGATRRPKTKPRIGSARKYLPNGNTVVRMGGGCAAGFRRGLQKASPTSRKEYTVN